MRGPTVRHHRHPRPAAFHEWAMWTGCALSVGPMPTSRIPACGALRQCQHSRRLLRAIRMRVIGGGHVCCIAHHRPSTIPVVHGVHSSNTHHMPSVCIPYACSSCVVRCMSAASSIHHYILRTNTSRPKEGCGTNCRMELMYKSGSIG